MNETPTPIRGRTRPRVLLTTEGTYPHYRGGSATWCDLLIRETDDADFVVWALMMNPFVKQTWTFPSNVVQFVGVPLWGVEQPSEYTREIPTAQVFQSARRTKHADVERHFLPLFQRFLDAISSALFFPEEFALVLAEMHAYFRTWEYRSTWRSPVVWEAFCQKLLEPSGFAVPPALLSPSDGQEPPIPTFDKIRDNLRYLVKGPADSNGYPESQDVPTVNEAMEGLRWMYRLMQTLNVEVPVTDVTHSAAAAFCAIPCILAKVERGTPFLLTEHGVYLREQYLNIERRRFPYHLKRFLIDAISAVALTSYSLADQVSPVCEFNSRWELNYGTTPDRLKVIYNGVDETLFQPRQVSRSPRPTVVHGSRIDAVLKDNETMVRVAARVRQEIPDVLFIQFGGTDDEEYMREIRALAKELRVDDNIRWLGGIPFSDVPDVYNQGDVSLLTSVSEAFPYAVVESMMCGVPVVATAVGGVQEALNGAGRTASPKDVEGLAAGVIGILRLPPDERAALSRHARERAVSEFRIDNFSQQYRESYYRLAALPAIPVTRPAAAPAVPVVEAATAAVTQQQAPLVIPPPARVPEPAAEEPAAGWAGVAELMGALADPDPFVRVSTIRRTGTGPGVRDALLAALDDELPAVRREAVRALVRAGADERTVNALADLMVRDQSPEVREEAADAVGAFLGGARTESGTA